MRASDLVIEWENTLGENLLATDVREAWQYVDGKKTERLAGWSIECASPRMRLDKIVVKVLSRNKPFEIVDGEPVSVKFSGLSGKVYVDFRSGQLKESITAESVIVLDE